jgi:hypothetical protein
MSSLLQLRLLALCLVPVVIATIGCVSDQTIESQNDPNEEEWVELFNGEDLNGWQAKIAHYEPGDNFGNTFRVVDGVIQVNYDAYEDFNRSFGNLFWKDSYSHYRLLVEYRFTGEWLHDTPSWAYRNSGIMFHSQAPETMLAEQDFPISLEAQFLGGLGQGERHTMSVCTPGTEIYMDGEKVGSHCTTSTSATFDGDQWVTVEIEVLGSESVRHLADGQVVMEYQDPEIGGPNVEGHDPATKPDGQSLGEGYIALQSEGSPLEFRRVALLNLTGCMTPSASTYKSYYVNSDDSTCQ